MQNVIPSSFCLPSTPYNFIPQIFKRILSQIRIQPIELADIQIHTKQACKQSRFQIGNKHFMSLYLGYLFWHQI